MNRRGSAIIVVLALLTLAAVAAAGSAVDRVRRQQALAQRSARIVAREVALGAACLHDGQTVAVGAWTAHRDGVRLIASGPAGTCTITPDREHWQPRRRR